MLTARDTGSRKSKCTKPCCTSALLWTCGALGLLVAAIAGGILISLHAPSIAGTTRLVPLFANGQLRSFLLHVPSASSAGAAREPLPLVVCFHGWYGTSAGIEALSQLSAMADANRFLVAYPQGLSENFYPSWNAAGSSSSPGSQGPTCTPAHDGTSCYTSCAQRPQGCDPSGCDWTTCEDDGAFVDAVVHWIGTRHSIDRRRIFATGFSNGGFMAYEMAMHRSALFAAVVAVGGGIHPGFLDTSVVAASGGIALLDIHGSADTTCPANKTAAQPVQSINPAAAVSHNDWLYTPIDTIVAAFASAASCASTAAPGGGAPGSALVAHPTEWDGGALALSCLSASACAAGKDVVRCAWNGAHDWPSFASELAWSFFISHPRAAPAAGGGGASDAGSASDATRAEEAATALAAVGLAVGVGATAFAMLLLTLLAWRRQRQSAALQNGAQLLNEFLNDGFGFGEDVAGRGADIDAFVALAGDEDDADALLHLQARAEVEEQDAEGALEMQSSIAN